MSQAFDGRWVDENGTEITITSHDDFVSVQYAGGRGPFTGVAVTIGFSVIYVDFTDDRPYTGVLTVNSKRSPEYGEKILWNNETVWRRI